MVAGLACQTLPVETLVRYWQLVAATRKKQTTNTQGHVGLEPATSYPGVSGLHHQDVITFLMLNCHTNSNNPKEFWGVQGASELTLDPEVAGSSPAVAEVAF